MDEIGVWSETEYEGASIGSCVSPLCHVRPLEKTFRGKCQKDKKGSHSRQESPREAETRFAVRIGSPCKRVKHSLLIRNLDIHLRAAVRDRECRLIVAGWGK